MTRRGEGPAAGARVLFVTYTNPAGYPPIERAAKVFADLGAEVRVLGASGLVTDTIAPRSDPRIDIRLISRVGSGVRQVVSYARFTVWAAYHLLRWRPRWLYVSDPFAAPVGIAGWLLRITVLYHEHDVPAPATHSPYSRLVGAMRRLLLRRAPIVIAPSAGRAAVLSRVRGRDDVVVVWNCPSMEEIGSRKHGGGSSTLRLAYHGSLVPARLPVAVVDAMASLRGPVSLTLVGYEPFGGTAYVDALRARARELGLEDAVRYLGTLPRESMLREAATADLGLALMPMRSSDVNEQTMAGASNKAFEYLAQGTPVLVSDLPDWRAMFVDSGVALCCASADASSIAAALDEALSDRARLSAMGERGRGLVKAAWNYETRFRAVLERLGLASPGGSVPAADVSDSLSVSAGRR
ncbi:MAG TPA: glycosyltransferase [Gemmatimonadaceae bacterium]